ncbi:MAG: DUF6714 family protein [Gammaproteobacteria bacterium]
MAAIDPDALADRIARAFADAAWPGDDRLTDSRYGEEPAALVRDFRGRDDWTALDAAFLDQAPEGWSTAMAFFSGDALAFYLPAYLIADLRGGLVHTDPSLRLCVAVTPQAGARRIARHWGGGTLGEIAREEFARLSPAQVRVVVDYLWWKLEHESYNPTIEQALERYWLERAEAAAG